MNKLLVTLAVISSLNLIHFARCSLELDVDWFVYGVQDREVTLKCKVITDKDIKLLTWYKEDDYNPAKLETIYYYEPSTSIDSSVMEGFSRSTDGTSLVINPVKLSDEGRYKCLVQVWNDPDKSNSSSIDVSYPGSNIPEEESVTMKLIVYVPPDREQLSTFSAQKNITLTCKAFNAKPAAKILWFKTDSDGISEQLSSNKFITDAHGDLSDSTGHLYYTLSGRDNFVRLSCLIKHGETNTTIYKNVTMVSPIIQNAVDMVVDRLGGSISYSSVMNQNDKDSAASFVKISADPGLEVAFNSSVTLTASAPGVFPEPSFMWWTGDEAAYSGSNLYIPHVDSNQLYYVLAQNPVGRVLLSVPLTVVDADNIDENTNSTSTEDDEEEPATAPVNGGLIAACVIGAMLFLLFVGLTIWYCTCRNPPNEGIPNVRKKKDSKRHIEEEDAFIPSQKPLMRTTSTQTLEGKRQSQQKRESQRLTTGEDSPQKRESQKSKKKNSPPPEYATKERPMDKHLKEYDESASFVGDYGSRLGLESNASAENLHSAREEEDSRSEESIPDSDDSTNAKIPDHREDIV